MRSPAVDVDPSWACQPRLPCSRLVVLSVPVEGATSGARQQRMDKLGWGTEHGVGRKWHGKLAQRRTLANELEGEDGGRSRTASDAELRTLNLIGLVVGGGPKVYAKVWQISEF